jgi:pseudaminic acid cytidylyltransferase
VPFRRSVELSDDHAGTDEVFTHALRWAENYGELPDYACCLYATAPFVRPDDLARGLHILRDADASSAFAVTPFDSPIFRALKVEKNGRMRMLWPEHRLTRSQDLPAAVHDAGQFYWLNTAKYLAEGRLFSADSVPILLPRHQVVDIDTPEDWKQAEIMFEILTKHVQAHE